jgi:hypothetical protein
MAGMHPNNQAVHPADHRPRRHVRLVPAGPAFSLGPPSVLDFGAPAGARCCADGATRASPSIVGRGVTLAGFAGYSGFAGFAGKYIVGSWAKKLE